MPTELCFCATAVFATPDGTRTETQRAPADNAPVLSFYEGGLAVHAAVLSFDGEKADAEIMATRRGRLAYDGHREILSRGGGFSHAFREGDVTATVSVTLADA